MQIEKRFLWVLYFHFYKKKEYNIQIKRTGTTHIRATPQRGRLKADIFKKKYYCFRNTNFYGGVEI